MRAALPRSARLLAVAAVALASAVGAVGVAAPAYASTSGSPAGTSSTSRPAAAPASASPSAAASPAASTPSSATSEASSTPASRAGSEAGSHTGSQTGGGAGSGQGGAGPSGGASSSSATADGASPTAVPSGGATSSPAPTAWKPKVAPGVTGVVYAVLPHPDDEFQVWSQVQQTPDLFKVFVMLTHGEESSNCDPAMPGFDRGFEPAPAVLPQGRWTPSCEEARLDSWRGFYSDMAATDASVPGALTDRGEVTRLVGSRSTPVCRVDADPGTCASRSRSARVWTDDGGHGALVVFDLGDRDVTPAEVVWAMQAVRDNRSRLGIDPSLPSRGVVGAYFDEVTSSGFRYPHPDHRAVADALEDTDLRMGPQLGATASDDPHVRVTGAVSEQAMSTAFGWGDCSGAHARRYGWLWSTASDPSTPDPARCYQVDRGGQSRLFHRMQYFWEAFAPASPAPSGASTTR